MTISRCFLAVTVIVVAASLADHAQQPDPKFGASTTAVVIDVVVRDTKGRPVTDLTRADFELLEDGVLQELGDVTRVGVPDIAASRRPRAAGPAAPTTATAHPSPRSVPAPTFLAIVIDRLTPEARALAYKGALASLETSQANDFVGVFLSDMSLVSIQTYTTDRVKLRKAIDEAATRATSVFDREAIKEPTEMVFQAAGDFHPSVPVVASAESPGRPAEDGAGARYHGGSSGGAGPPIGGVGQASLLATSAFERLSRDHQGFTTVNALRAVIEGLSVLPGRKSVVFFAEGLALPEAVMQLFESLVATANRAYVSVYTIDAAGLRVHSKDAETGREIRTIGAQSMVVNPDGSTGGSLGAMERMDDVLRKDPRTSLTMLAERTGGFLIENTNDLGHGFREIEVDRRFHYLLTYTPKKLDFAGEWRRVEVRIPGRKVEVRSRSGYPAVRLLSAIPLLAYEGPALAALERTPPPADLPLRLGAFVFPEMKDGSRAALMVAASGQTLTFEATPDGFRTDFTMMARVKDASGEIVRKGSQPYRLTGPAAERERTQQGEVLFYRQPELQPGTYTLEAVVHDALGPRAGVARVPFEVPAGNGLRVSSLVIVSRTERLMSSELDADNPLQAGNRLIYPNLGEPLRRRRGDTVAFYFTIVPGGSEPTRH
jgi:VWFA-related protein